MRNPLVYLWLICLVICGNIAQSQSLNVTDFEAYTKKTGVQIIDVRTIEEFTEGHLPKAINIDVFDDNFVKNTHVLKKNQPVLVYCYSGGRSSEAVEILTKLGFKQVYELKGGLSAWRKQNKPINK